MGDPLAHPSLSEWGLTKTMNWLQKQKDKLFASLMRYLVQWAYGYYYEGNRGIPSLFAPSPAVLKEIVEEQLLPFWKLAFTSGFNQELRERIFHGEQGRRVADAITSDIANVFERHVGGEWGAKDLPFIDGILASTYARVFDGKAGNDDKHVSEG
jgi:hypothetical protein